MDIIDVLANDKANQAIRLKEAINTIISLAEIFNPVVVRAVADYIETKRFSTETEHQEILSEIAKFLRRASEG